MARWTQGDRTDLINLIEGHGPSKLLSKLLAECDYLIETGSTTGFSWMTPAMIEDCKRTAQLLRDAGIKPL